MKFELGKYYKHATGTNYIRRLNKMKFEIGKYYKHTTGSKLYICGLAETYYHGRCFIGEDEYGKLSPIGSSEENAINYSEISKEEFIGVERS